MNRTEIAPGVMLTELSAEKFTHCRVSVNFLWPMRRETATAEAMLPYLMERGTAACPDMTELSKVLAGLYGASYNVSGSTLGANRVLTVSVTGLRDAYALEGEALGEAYAKLAAGAAFAPYLPSGAFDAEAVEIEREQLRRTLEGEINDKRTYCLRQARRKFYGDAPEGIERSGYLDEVDAVTPQSLAEAYAHMVRTARIEVTVLGVDAKTVRAQVCEALADVRRAPATPVPPAAMPACAPRRFDEPMDTVQGKLCLLFTAGAPVPEEKLSAVRVASALLGGTPTSRLFLNVREKQSLCYYCAAGANARGGTLCIDSGVEHANADAAEAAVLHELEALRTGEITEKELAETKLCITDAMKNVEDTLGGTEAWYLNEIFRGTNQTPAAAAAALQAVTADDVRAALSAFSLSVVYRITKEARA